ncbi:polysaccharide deacetylase family sporulation protein PdaB [Clostridium sp. CM028]|uniref:polysaccharide deacetylase family sporulation protein PdaB n=1 Tax=Clostridium sp. CF011 TaxID=2843318 RepID=UPI0013EE946D|nr:MULTISPECIES: polysaccharide deacetylase family sporulation protein PdaB [unclassified Clostridium]MBZ9608887.1 polysaccharide deacetylase family sporulation protein PdaB [Clostridium estertheticum]MBU3092475.1 polysaccharide deacetylase family sporulation protein PdaB [Clostridium sp. CF011]MBW9148033.1 polysaccharide deacetylase family sporulation protein PdaB [Clostridium sp. CM028]WAG69773.1 polysaccharide deacetylase family sporulation protein PdaB [Clostridium sp. CF011]WLC61457.1 pol
MNMNYIKKKLIVFCAIFIVILSIIGVYNLKTKGAFLGEQRKLPIYSVDTKEKKIAISFDANWGDDRTDDILKILDKYNAKATFFIVGAWLDQYPDRVKTMHQKGHEIGNHSNKHPIMTTISKERMNKEITTTDAKIMAITGKETTLFRCPSGEYNNLVIETVESTNHYCIQWDADSIDWKEQGAEIEYNRIIKKTKPGSILLFHNNAKYTPENLEKILKHFKAQGYKFVKISDLIYKKNYYINESGKQIQK